MAKEYDFQKMKQLVKDNAANGLASMRVGMAEDWFWTAEEVWNKKDGFLSPVEEGYVAGITGSDWATPIAIMEFEDNSTIAEECYISNDEYHSETDKESMKLWAKLTGGIDSFE